MYEYRGFDPWIFIHIQFCRKSYHWGNIQQEPILICTNMLVWFLDFHIFYFSRKGWDWMRRRRGASPSSSTRACRPGSAHRRPSRGSASSSGTSSTTRTELWVHLNCTDKKECKICLICKEIQKGSGKVIDNVPDPNPDPDPHVFEPPGSGPISQRYGSGSGSRSFHHPPIIKQK